MPTDIFGIYKTCERRIPIGKWAELRIMAVKDPDALIDAIDPQAFADDERLPYWAEIWPASIAMGIHFFEHPLAPGTEVLELGCGTGVAGIAAARAGLRVTACDYEADALSFARHNAALNGVSDMMTFRPLDWRTPDLNRRFDLIAGSDVTYERPDHDPILAFLLQTLSPGGTFLLSDPDRSSAPEFIGLMKDAGFIHTPQPRRIRYEGNLTRVTVHRFVHPVGPTAEKGD